MSQIYIYLLLIHYLITVSAKYMNSEMNYSRKRLERNNKVNKGVWVRNQKEQIGVGEFIFMDNSLEAGQNQHAAIFDIFGDNPMPETPSITEYVERNKRSPLPKSTTNGNGNSKSQANNVNYNIGPIKRSVFNKYPFVAILLASNEANNTNELKINQLTNAGPVIEKENSYIDLSSNNDIDILSLNEASNKTAPLKAKKDLEPEIIKRIVNKEDSNNKTKDVRDCMKNDEDINVYKVIPAVIDTKTITPSVVYVTEPSDKSPATVSEEKIVKILDTLGRMFKKILKHHDEVKKLHQKIKDMNVDVTNKIADVMKKIEENEEKFNYAVKLEEKIKDLEAKKDINDEHNNMKFHEMALSLKEFEIQQKKFLDQQAQFYNLQKLILTQNEKINLKQGMIAQTQSDIVHKQNNFARFLKKTKQLFSKKHSKVNSASKNDNAKVKTTKSPSKSEATTENVKINLFSVPTSKRLPQTQNQDKILLKEKDMHAIDDLVYRFYFNNTYIDEIMKNNYLQGFYHDKRDSETTNNNAKDHTRRRRWINSHSKKRYIKKKSLVQNHINAVPADLKVTTKVTQPNVAIQTSTAKTIVNVAIPKFDTKFEPFVQMATNFCKGVGQNYNQQTLNWCIEKALRKLQNIDLHMPPPPIVENKLKAVADNEVDGGNKLTNPLLGLKQNKPIVLVNRGAHILKSTSAPEQSLTGLDGSGASDIFFPDNEALELNLKRYDLTPDTEGNVYYEGSLHASDIIPDSDVAVSDIIPGMDSNSRVDMDPITFDLQSKRRAYVRKINANILKKAEKKNVA